jgi:hypothetical protein
LVGAGFVYTLTADILSAVFAFCRKSQKTSKILKAFKNEK